MDLLIHIVDLFGVYGQALHYSLVIFFVGGAFLVFLCLWKKGRLDMDEEPKIQMMQREEDSDESRR